MRAIDNVQNTIYTVPATKSPPALNGPVQSRFGYFQELSHTLYFSTSIPGIFYTCESPTRNIGYHHTALLYIALKQPTEATV